jgi:hypothetical protein
VSSLRGPIGAARPLAMRVEVIGPGRRSVPAHAEVQTVAVDGVGHIELLLSLDPPTGCPVADS